MQVVFSIYDKRGKPSTTSVYLADSEGMSRITLFSVAWADAIDNLIGGVIRTAKGIFQGDISGLSSNVASSGSDVEEIAAVQYKTLYGQRVDFNIPAVNETLVNNDTGELNGAASAVVALYSMFEDGIDVGGSVIIQPTDVGGEYADRFVYGRERSRNSGARRRN